MNENSLLFEGYKVLVTAGASGIGESIAKGFFQRGASVHVVDVDPEAIKQFQTNFPKDSVRCTTADVSNEQLVKDVFASQVENLGGIDVLINCAGIKGPTGAVEDILLRDWQRCIEVNLQGTFLCSKYAVPHMKEQKSGSIINLSSTAGWHGYPLRSPYASAKWAVIGFTKSLAMELGPFGVRANAICPGTVDGARMDQVISDEASAKGLSEAQVREGYTKGVSLRTMIDAEDIAQTAMFLASNAANKITGQYISVDGHLENVGGLDI